MADLTIQRGDYGFYIDGTITDADGSDFDLSDYTLSFKAWELGNWEHPIVEGSATTVVATQGTWKYLLAQNDFITPGEFLCAVRATKTNAQETTQQYTVEVKEAP